MTDKKSEVKNVNIKKTKSARFIDDAEIIAKLKEFKGMQYLTAEALGVSAGYLSERINSSEVLQQARKEATERRVDVAELNLAKLTEEMNLGAICFLLKTKGKDRGYVETNDVQVNPDVIKNYMALMQSINSAQKKED